MRTLIIKKEVEEKEISSKFSKECRNWLEALYWKIKYRLKGYEVGELKDEDIN